MAPSTGLKRSRNGCQSCRLRRRKCDGGRPVCSNCSKKNSACLWGLKASFHPSRLLSLSTSEKQALVAIENGRRNNDPDERRTSTSIIDNTPDVIRNYQRSSNLAHDVSGACETTSDDDVADDESEPFARRTVSSEHIGLDSSVLNTINKNLAPEATAVGVLYPVVANEFTTSPQIQDRIAVQNTGTDGDITVDLNHILNDTFSDGNFGRVISGESFTPPFSLGVALSRKNSPFREPEFPIDECQTLQLLRSFLTESATWCETTDTSKQFSFVCAHDMLEHKIFKASALALACRQLSATGSPLEDVALQLYQYTVQLLIQQDPDHADASILAACTLLCVYEMMASEVVHWRRHLKGCAGLLLSKKWNGSSNGLIKTCFWAFARIDVWAAFILGKRTLISTNNWVNYESLHTASALDSPDDYCNLSILYFARVVNCLGKDDIESATPESSIGLQQLWRQLQEWWNLRPKRGRPLCRLGPMNSNPFPTLLFTYSAAICGNTFYHAGCLLLLNKIGVKLDASQDKEKVKSLSSVSYYNRVIHSNAAVAFKPKIPPLTDHSQTDPVWHAKELCGISVSNNDHANWVNHLQPLYIAGGAFGPQKRRTSGGNHEPISNFGSEKARTLDVTSFGKISGPQFTSFNEGGEDDGDGSTPFAAEQIALLRHLIRIQRETGWKTESRAKELRVLWGLQ